MSLMPFNGQKVFYAVSNKGNVIIKAEKDMTAEEQALFSKTERKNEKIQIPVENILLNENKINLQNGRTYIQAFSTDIILEKE